MSILYEGKTKKLNFFGHNSPAEVDFYCGKALNDFAMVLINLKYRDRSLQESYTELLHLLIKGGCRVDSDMNPVEFDQTSGEMLINKDYVLRVPPDVLVKAQQDPNGQEAAILASLEEGMVKLMNGEKSFFIFPSDNSDYKVEIIK